MPQGLFRPVCFGQGHQRHFLLGKKAPYEEIVNFYWSISRAQRQWPRGMEAIAFLASLHYQACSFLSEENTSNRWRCSVVMGPICKPVAQPHCSHVLISASQLRVRMISRPNYNYKYLTKPSHFTATLSLFDKHSPCRHIFIFGGIKPASNFL